MKNSLLSLFLSYTVVIDSTSSKEGFIRSPLYPSSSKTQENRLYKFVGGPDERVQIIFDDFDLHKLPPNEKCVGVQYTKESVELEPDCLSN